MKLRVLKSLVRLGVAVAFVAFSVPPLQAQRSIGAGTAPFEMGEELVYEAEFSRALLRKVDIADFRFTAIRVAGKNQSGEPLPTLRLTGEVATKGFFSRLFNLRVRERIESSIDPVTFSVLKTVKLDEQGKRVRTSEALFDRALGKVTWTERDPNNPKQQPRVMTTSFAGVVQDIVSAIYFARMQPLEVGKGFQIQVSDSGRIYGLPITVVERRKMKTLLGRIGTIRIDPEIFGPDRLVRGKGKFSIWLSDDARRVPVRARLSNDLGTFDIKLKRVTTIPQSR